MRYFSAFAGIGVTELAFKKVFPDSECVGYCEIDPCAVAVYERHFPNHKNYGDIKTIDILKLPKFDMFVFGSPCTDLSSFQFTKLEWKGTRSILFYDALKILQICKPKYFLMENVASMRKEICRDITNALNGIEPVLIDSVCFGPGHRRRYYWCNFPVVVPKANVLEGLHIADVLTENKDALNLNHLTFKGKLLIDHLPITRETKPYCISHHNHKYYLPRTDDKFNPILTTQSLLNVVFDGYQLRYMNSNEIEQCQTLPKDYTKYGSFSGKDGKHSVKEIVKTKRHKLVGNAFHLETIVYILKQLKNSIQVV